MTPRRQRWLLLAALLVAEAGALSTGFVPSPHSGGDNAAYLILGHSLVEGHGYRDLYLPGAPPHTKYPPVLPMVLGAIMLVGGSTWTVFKLVSILSILAATGLVFLWVERRSGPWTALAVAALSGFSAAWLYAANWVLSDPLFVALTLGAIVAFDRWMVDGDGSDEAGPHRAAGARGSGSHDRVRGLARFLPSRPAPGAETGGRGWLIAGVVLVVLAAFTRSAGLPLVLAVTGWLVWRRAPRAAAGLAIGWAIPMALWWVRGRSVGADYVSEFRLLDPYRPELGLAGPIDFAQRILDNLSAYGSHHIPAGFVGGGVRELVVLLGFALAAFGALGWWIRARERLSVAEVFAPLYLGLILLWPVVWSGDRFALPLYPLILYWAAVGVRAAITRIAPAAGFAAGVLAVAALAIPEARGWAAGASEARLCRLEVERAGVYACAQPGFASYARLAERAAEHLPANSVTVARKPRFFYLVSGMQAVPVPFTEDPERYFASIDSAGADFIVFDVIDGTSSRTTGTALNALPARVCMLAVEGTSRNTASFIFRVLDGTTDLPLTVEGGGPAPCPAAPEWAADSGRGLAYSGTIPILASGPRP